MTGPRLEPAGVQLQAPASEHREAIEAQVLGLVGELPEGKHGALVGVLTQAANGKLLMNLAVAHRTDNGWAIGAYVGKTWGDPVTFGATIRRTW